MNKEEKKKNFEMLAEKRVSEIIKRLQILGNLSNKSNYHYNQEHVDQIFKALDKEFKNLKIKFSENKESTSDSFKFK
jgi:hypothetical protein